MSLWRGTVLYTVFCALALALGLSLSLKHFALGAFDASERAQALEGVTAVERALTLTAEEFGRRTLDWSDWDDAVEYVREGGEDFESSNLILTSMRSTEWHLFTVWSPSRGFRAVRYADADFHAFHPLTAQWRRWLAPDGPLLAGTSAHAPARQGFAVIDGAVWMVVSSPVRHSDQRLADEPGRMVIARRMSAAADERIQRLTRLGVRVLPLDAPASDRWDRGALPRLRARPARFVHALSDAHFIGFSSMADMTGRPAVRARVTLPRPGRAQALHALRVMLVTVGVFVLIAGVLVARTVRRAVALPLARLTETAQRLGRGERALVPEGGVAEFATLARAFNTMAEEIAARESMLRTANEELRVARDTAESALSVRSTFLATMSHEIRTPMNGILGMATLLEEGGRLDPTQHEQVRVLRGAAEALLTLLNDVLDLSKIEAGRLSVESLQFDLGALCREVAQLFEVNARPRGLAVTCHVAADVPRALIGDPTRVRQVLVNLMGNAVKFTAAGEVSLRVTRAGDRYTLAVRDTGIGIGPEFLERLFQPFSQADSSFARRYGGTGLGLAISHRLAVLLGGALSVTSEPGRGSEFTLEVPFETVNAWHSPPAVSFSRAPEMVRSLRPKLFGTVLAAEDNDVNRKVLGSMLERLGYDALLVTDGAAAIEAIRARHFDAVLMDCQMPVIDGFEATRWIREHEAPGERVPVIAITANAMQGDRERCLEAGMDDYVTKPIRPKELERVLRRWIAQTELMVIRGE